MTQKTFNVLVLCTGNSCRSVMGEALVTALGQGRFIGHSAGSNPIGRINTGALATLARHGLPTEGYTSKSMDAFRDRSIDILISVCDSAGKEPCPVFLGPAIRAHWGVEDPGHVEGTPDEIIEAFEKTFDILKRRVQAMVDLPVENMTKEAITVELDRIGTEIN
ncbi:MAG: arsenate reductase ArsC [Gammaproteobacteria bacterium]|nr:arsenate reductase ArsC [Gammaproteobacteria bacterium]NBT43324.1 arsenate reductase ArsC [Gammaproteobacteria bacterium]NBY21386.1 arsenate reductase ArsC [Gammaproteobacteria bacterium]